MIRKQNVPMLQVLREELQLTKEDLSKKLKLSPSLYGKYELGKSLPNVATFKKIADYLVKSKVIDDRVYKSLLDDIVENKK